MTPEPPTGTATPSPPPATAQAVPKHRPAPAKKQAAPKAAPKVNTVAPVRLTPEPPTASTHQD
jgi:hypothetical protein